MTAPRLEIDLDKISHNAAALVDRLGAKGITVTGVTKALLGSPALANAMLRGGVQDLADARVENLASLRANSITVPIALIRSPMLSQVRQVVEAADTSLNSEADVIAALSVAARAQNRTHGIVLMVEMGDLREGVLANDLFDLVRATLRASNVALVGLGTNLGCQSGVVPDATNMGELSRLADAVEAAFGVELAVVSGGNSANLEWALACTDPGRVNNLRLGESILLGRETLHGNIIPGLHTDAIVLVGEVIEAKTKPAQPWGAIARSAFGEPVARSGVSVIAQSLIALGHQDVDPGGLTAPPGMEILGASSDHLVIDAGDTPCAVGTELRFHLDYRALLRAMTSPFVAKAFRGG